MPAIPNIVVLEGQRFSVKNSKGVITIGQTTIDANVIGINDVYARQRKLYKTFCEVCKVEGKRLRKAQKLLTEE